jgi:hypothetical protein
MLRLFYFSGTGNARNVATWLAAAWKATDGMRRSSTLPLTLGFLLLAYRLLHRGLRVRAIERIVVWSSLTHFGFWRRYRPRRAHVGANKQDAR